MLIDQTGEIKATLAQGEHKSLQTDRGVLVPGPADEVRTVNRLYNPGYPYGFLRRQSNS